MGADEALSVDAGSFSVDFSSFSYYGCVVAVDPFTASKSDDGVGVQGGGGMVEVLGSGAVDLGDPDWVRFCCDFLLVDGSVMSSQADLVSLVDGVLNGVVYALTGCGEYADWSVASSARLMKFVGQLHVIMVLFGGVGVLPWGVALGRYGGDPVVARKMVRWVGWVGRCAQGLVCAAWPLGVWSGGSAGDPAVVWAWFLRKQCEAFVCAWI